MIISRTPFRVSFVGGGTDLAEFYRKESGKVFSTTIDKYVYVAVKRQMDIVDFKYRISWSKIEFKNSIDEIEHPLVREALKLMEIDFPLEVTTFADVPANTGLGSSSTFMVGLLHALFALKGKMVTKHELARLAAYVEVDLLKRHMGKQDHYAAAYGNINVITFCPDESVNVDPVFYDPEIKTKLESRLMLFYTRLKRDASEVLKKQKQATSSKFESLKQMKALVDPLVDIISHNKDLKEFGRILHQGWLLKKSLTDEISNEEIDQYYAKALAAGALGGKLLGAGSGGFLLFYVEPQNQAKVAQALQPLYQMKFKFEDDGTRVTYYDQKPF